MTPKEEIKAKVKAIAEEPIATATVLVINENGEHIYTMSEAPDPTIDKFLERLEDEFDVSVDSPGKDFYVVTLYPEYSS